MATKPFYIHQKPPAQSFTRLPNFLFEAPSFCSLSSEAKLLYAMILRRTDLSRKNGWADDYGKIYLYYPINEVCERTPKSSGHPARAAICRFNLHQETRVWKTQPYLPKIL